MMMILGKSKVLILKLRLNNSWEVLIVMKVLTPTRNILLAKFRLLKTTTMECP